MGNYVVTFRLKDNAGYQKRYESFIDRLYKLSAQSGVWEETSSFIAFEYAGSLEDVYSALYFESDFDPDVDTLLVIDVLNRKKATGGVIKYSATLDKCLGF